MDAREVSFRFVSLACVLAFCTGVLAATSAASAPASDVTGTGTARWLAETWGLSLRVDPDLSAAARAHARAVARGRVQPEAFLDQLKKTGLGDAHVAPFAAVGSNPDQVRAQLVQAARPVPGSPEPTHIGAGWAQSGDRWVLVAVLAHRWLEWQGRKNGLNLRVRGQASARLVDPDLELFVLGPCIEGVRCPIRTESLQAPFGFQVEAGSGFVAAEVLAETGTGPTVVGLWWLGDPPPVPHAGSRQWVPRLRRTLGLGPLRSDPRLVRAARGHAERICPSRWAAHRTSAEDGPAARARAEGYLAPVGENVAVASSRRRAHQNLWWSPAHHQLLVDPDAVVYGEAEAHSGDRTCVVQLFGYGP